jgi:hypothetical protein
MSQDDQANRHSHLELNGRAETVTDRHAHEAPKGSILLTRQPSLSDLALQVLLLLLQTLENREFGQRPAVASKDDIERACLHLVGKDSVGEQVFVRLSHR